jgi:hypothetical protein
VAKGLLEEQIFESTLNAKIKFPEVFEVSPAQSAERTASEAEAARTEADAIKDAAESRLGALTLREEDENSELQKGKEKEMRKSLFQLRLVRRLTIDIAPLDCYTRHRKRSFPYTTNSVLSLYPVYLPFRTQHQLLVKVQAVLEEACYTFGQKTIEDVLHKEGWDCPESVELNL